MPAPATPPLSAKQSIARGILITTAAVLLGCLLNIVLLSQLQHLVGQQQLRAAFAEDLAAGTAPVSEGDYNNVLLSDGDPVAQLTIPAIGVSEIVVEGTSSATLTRGPGHRRDTVLPGQAGVCVLMGRAAAYGGPFGRIKDLAPGATITTITGQGQQSFRVTAIRYAGDPDAALPAGGSRLILESARGWPFLPSGIVRVDAELTSTVLPDGARQTTTGTLPAADHELAADPSTAWMLVFALQFLILTEAVSVWSFRRFGTAKAWSVLTPVLLLSVILAADQLGRLLPNLM